MFWEETDESWVGDGDDYPEDELEIHLNNINSTVSRLKAMKNEKEKQLDEILNANLSDNESS
jgi:hypothetical protein